MTYSDGRVICDADSHVMEPSDWILPYLDERLWSRLTAVKHAPFDRAEAKRIHEQRQADTEAREGARGQLMTKIHNAYGAWDGAERSEVLDILGFQAQLVFTTFAVTQFATLRSDQSIDWGTDTDLLYAGARAHNLALRAFCAADPRLIDVPFAPLLDPERGSEEVRQLLSEGCRAVLVNTDPHPELAPSHPAFDQIWNQLSEAGVPFMLHLGFAGPLVPPSYHNNGRPQPPDLYGGGEDVRSKDMLGIHVWPDYFLSTLALDGVFERFPGLRGGCIEQGATWVVGMLKRLDLVQGAFARTEPTLAELPRLASDYIRERVKFTPFPREDIGWLIGQGCEEMVMFSTDYPHLEGGRDPIARFEETMGGVSDVNRRRFYADNFCSLLGAC
jgi:predicted TIM-barrel fold metal-dependent hydrolase